MGVAERQPWRLRSTSFIVVDEGKPKSSARTSRNLRQSSVQGGGDRGGHSRYNRLPGGRDRGRCCIAHQEGRRWIRGHVGQDEQDLCWGGGGSCLNKPTSCKRFLNWRSSSMTGSPKAEAGGP